MYAQIILIFTIIFARFTSPRTNTSAIGSRSIVEGSVGDSGGSIAANIEGSESTSADRMLKEMRPALPTSADNISSVAQTSDEVINKNLHETIGKEVEQELDSAAGIDIAVTYPAGMEDRAVMNQSPNLSGSTDEMIISESTNMNETSDVENVAFTTESSNLNNTIGDENGSMVSERSSLDGMDFEKRDEDYGVVRNSTDETSPPDGDLTHENSSHEIQIDKNEDIKLSTVGIQLDLNEGTLEKNLKNGTKTDDRVIENDHEASDSANEVVLERENVEGAETSVTDKVMENEAVQVNIIVQAASQGTNEGIESEESETEAALAGSSTTATALEAAPSQSQ